MAFRTAIIGIFETTLEEWIKLTGLAGRVAGLSHRPQVFGIAEVVGGAAGVEQEELDDVVWEESILGFGRT